MLAIRAIAKCLNDHNGLRGAGTRGCPCTILRFLRPEPGKAGAAYAEVKFDGFDRVYLKNVNNLEIVHAPTRVHEGEAA